MDKNCCDNPTLQKFDAIDDEFEKMASEYFGNTCIDTTWIDVVYLQSLKTKKKRKRFFNNNHMIHQSQRKDVSFL